MTGPSWRRLIFLLFLGMSVLSGSGALDFTIGTAEGAGSNIKTALLKEEGGCVFTVVEGYPPFRLDFEELSEAEKKSVSKPFDAGDRLEAFLPIFFEKVMYSTVSGCATCEKIEWEKPERLIDDNFGTIFIPAVAAQLQTAGQSQKLRFLIGDEGSYTSGSIFLGDGALHLIVDEISGKAYSTESGGRTIPVWKLVALPPVKYKKTESVLKHGKAFNNWVYSNL